MPRGIPNHDNLGNLHQSANEVVNSPAAGRFFAGNYKNIQKGSRYDLSVSILSSSLKRIIWSTGYANISLSIC